MRSVQTTLTRIIIVLESVTHGLSENWDEISRKALKFKGFLRPKSGGLQKKKGLHRFWDWFFGPNRKILTLKIRWSPKKKKVFTKIETVFSAIQTFEGGLFSNGGVNFSQKTASKPPKWCGFAYFTSQWGGLESPPVPPWLRYCIWQLNSLFISREYFQKYFYLSSFKMTTFLLLLKYFFWSLLCTLLQVVFLSVTKILLEYNFRVLFTPLMRLQLRPNYLIGFAETLAVQDFSSSSACDCGATLMTCATYFWFWGTISPGSSLVDSPIAFF